MLIFTLYNQTYKCTLFCYYYFCLQMGLSSATFIRLVALAIFVYSFKFRIDPSRLSKVADVELLAHLNEYGSVYRYLTVISYLITMLVNFLLVVGDFIPRGNFQF